MITLTPHATDRIQNRFSHLTTPGEVLARVNLFKIADRRAYIEIKRFPYCEVADDSVKPDGVARGNQLVAVYEEGRIESVMLRKNWEVSPEYHKVFRHPNKEK